MHVKKSLIFPIVVILAGVVLQLNALGLLGDVLPGDILMKLWPVLLVAAGLDLLFVQRRIIGAAVIIFFGAALLSTQFLASGTNSELWQIFLKFWPILLILFGIDSIFSGRSMINAAVIIVGVVILVYALLMTLDIPVLKQLPINIDLTSIIPTSTFNGTIPQQPSPSLNNNPASPQQNAAPITFSRNGQLSILMPTQNAAGLNLTAASGKVSIKAGNPANQLVSGTVTLDAKEQLVYNASQSGQTAVYTLRSEGNAAGNSSNWDLTLSAQRTLAINTVMNSGYVKADLRGLNLSSVSIENKYGPIDVMTPQTSTATIRINAADGDVRVYIPKGGSIYCTITGSSTLDYPRNHYSFNGSAVMPMSSAQSPVAVEINANNGTVRIIESE